MIEHRPTRLLEALEGRVETLLGTLRESRVRQAAQRSRLDEFERRCVQLETRNAELATEAREESARRAALEHRLAELEARLGEQEAARLELLEENRELDEQNRELEECNARLRDNLPSDPTASLFQPQGRRAQGLAALMHHRSRHAPPAAQASAPADSPSAVPTASAEPTPVAEPIPAAERTPSTPGAAPAQAASCLASAGEAPSPQALLEQWYQRYGATFFKGHTRPLKVGIHEELTAREPWSEKLVRRALACYVNLPRYLKSVREGADRIGLDGQPAGQVDAAAAAHAHRKLERLTAERRRHQRPKRRGKTEASSSPTPRQTAPSASEAPPPDVESPRDLSEPESEPAEQRLQRKLDALRARHNAR